MMAILVVMVEDNSPYERGDVVDVFPDERTWFGEVANDQRFSIIRSDMSLEEASSFLAPEQGDPKLGRLRVRAFKLDLDRLPKDQSHISQADLLKAKTIKQPLQDFIGTDDKVIG